jgi:phage-related protein
LETVIKVNPSELNSNLLKKIKSFIGNKDNVDVTISLHEYDPEYVSELDKSIEQAERGEVVSMTMEEFVVLK